MANAALSLKIVADTLGWPEADALIRPPGAGPAMFAALAQNKIGRALGRFSADGPVRIGILTANLHGPTTEAPFALVAEFSMRVSAPTLKELQRLAWNFSHSPTLITIEPDIVRVWSCCEPPTPERDLEDYLVHQVQADDLVGNSVHGLENRAAPALHWLNLVSGEFFATRAARFSRDGRADQMLLGNLRHIRELLRAAGLDDDDVCHDLLARVIFVQFLFDRKDAEGAAALSPDKLAKLHDDGILHKAHTGLAAILGDYEDTYRLFDWLNEKFNGDLFPGKGDTAEERARGWQKERPITKPRHLALLADFIRGNIDMPTGQVCLWPQYSFDVIPLEFISSIYETFVTERAAGKGIYYTPPHLVDFVLDLVLPWNSTVWDLKILDPACGSGIFLVKAFQRLVHRWKAANPQLPMRAEVLRRLLTRNLLGVDKDPHAVRVACFSLYLAMCDEIEPRHYWTQVRFPSMRAQRLICSDFFEETGEFDSTASLPGYDLIIGNAPWGDSLVTPTAAAWVENQPESWAIANKDIGSLFLAKSARLLKPEGRIALIQSANALLFNSNKNAMLFRQQLFTRYAVDAIYNLSALRFRVFKRKTHTTKTSISPACIVVMRDTPPAPGHEIAYISPKTLPSLIDEFAIAIEPNDYRWVPVKDAANEPEIWPALMWGTARDLRLLQRLRTFPSFTRPPEGVTVRSREGIIFGDRKREVKHLRRRRMFDERAFSAASLTHLDADSLPRVGVIHIDSRASTDFSAFALPQLVIKQGWQIATRRFQARLVQSASSEGTLCTQSYITVHAPKPLLEVACLAYNSVLAVYFLQLTSGRMAAYRPEARVQDLLNLPIPAPTPHLLDGIKDYSDFDARIFDAFGLKDAERVLAEDLFNITLADFRADGPLPGSRPTAGSGSNREDVLTLYCEYFIRVLKAGFGRDKAIRATIFSAPADEPLPYRLVAFELAAEGGGISTRALSASELLGELQKLSSRAHEPGTANDPSMIVRRVARIYDGSGGAIPTIFILKPDAVRYWTRTAALNDGDEVAIDLFRWRGAAEEVSLG
jgi:hypothetical protein